MLLLVLVVSVTAWASRLEVDTDLVVPDASKTLREGALAPWNPISSNYYPNMLEQAMTAFGVDMDKPFEDLSEEDTNLILYGSDGKEFHFHYEMNLVVYAILTFRLKELSIISTSLP